jgi:catechol 2,3-dioxygenase-like lactoylglutathione lyase family enzyme
MFTKISTISIPIKDPEVAKAFYVNVLGCRVVEDIQAMPGMRWLRLELPGVETRLVLVTWFPKMPPGSLQGVILITPDIAGTRDELQKRGLQVSPIKQQPYGQEATFADPDGNGWVLQQPAPGR